MTPDPLGWDWFLTKFFFRHSLFFIVIVLACSPGNCWYRLAQGSENFIDIALLEWSYSFYTMYSTVFYLFMFLHFVYFLPVKKERKKTSNCILSYYFMATYCITQINKIIFNISIDSSWNMSTAYFKTSNLWLDKIFSSSACK